MNTAGGGTLSLILYAAVYIVGVRYLLTRREPPGHPSLTGAMVLWLIVAIPSLIGLASPALYDALSRQPEAIEQGQIWRLLTSTVVQDGGVAGTVFNLITLAFTAALAFRLLRPGAALITFTVGAVGFNAAAAYVWHAPGAGNSGATFFLLAATAMIRSLQRRTGPGGIVTSVIAAAGIVLSFTNDAHGTAILGGLLFGALVTAFGHALPEFSAL
ncbi:rhomboid family intramembrane serine protease [Arthrobacter sp. 08Y14]|uniref:rhomboid family intramembrane serine protease n=1 Tax=Arthrobacter sp. 08Y14 TaxID=2058885 RepID=UPI000CE39136|nr:rhomboid family intramembrane serine protease [Arthrobacter sp. 08Y14]